MKKIIPFIFFLVTALCATAQHPKDVKGIEKGNDGIIYFQGNNVVIPFALKGKVNYTFQIIVSKPVKLPKYLPELKFDLIQMNGEKKNLGGQRFVIPLNKYKTIKDKK